MLVLAFGWLMWFLVLWHLHLEHYSRSNHGIRQFLEVLLGIWLARTSFSWEEGQRRNFLFRLHFCNYIYTDRHVPTALGGEGKDGSLCSLAPCLAHLHFFSFPLGFLAALMCAVVLHDQLSEPSANLLRHRVRRGCRCALWPYSCRWLRAGLTKELYALIVHSSWYNWFYNQMSLCSSRDSANSPWLQSCSFDSCLTTVGGLGSMNCWKLQTSPSLQKCVRALTVTPSQTAEELDQNSWLLARTLPPSVNFSNLPVFILKLCLISIAIILLLFFSICCCCWLVVFCGLALIDQRGKKKKKAKKSFIKNNTFFHCQQGFHASMQLGSAGAVAQRHPACSWRGPTSLIRLVYILKTKN